MKLIVIALVALFAGALVGCNSNPPSSTPDSGIKTTGPAKTTSEPTKLEIQTKTLIPAKEATGKTLSSPIWDVEFGKVMDRTNNAMLAPVNALSELFSCETQEDCEIALGNLAPVLSPAVDALRKEITILESLEPPAPAEALHNSYLQTQKLRLEAFELYLAGLLNDDDALLEAGDDVFVQAQQQHINTLALTTEFIEGEEVMSPGIAWTMEVLAVQQKFLQNESNVAPALGAYFICETLAQCDIALRAIPSALRPVRASLDQLLDTLENLASPAMLTSCSGLQSVIYELIQLRSEAYDLFIRGVEEANNNLLDEGYRIYAQSTRLGDKFIESRQDCMQSLE